MAQTLAISREDAASRRTRRNHALAPVRTPLLARMHASAAKRVWRSLAPVKPVVLPACEHHIAGQDGRQQIVGYLQMPHITC